MLGERDQYSDGLEGECSGDGLAGGEQIRGGAWNTEDHVLAVGDQHILCGRALWGRGEEPKALPKERMGRVDDLDLGQLVL